MKHILGKTLPRLSALVAAFGMGAVFISTSTVTMGQESSVDNVVWSPVTLPIGGNPFFYAAAAQSSSNVAIGGSGNTLLRYDGNAWSTDASWLTFRDTASWTGTEIGGMAFDSNGYLHVVGTNGAYAYYNGSEWKAVDLGIGTTNLRAIWIDPATNTVLTGRQYSTIYTLAPDGSGGYEHTGSFSTGFTGGSDIMSLGGTDLNNVYATVASVPQGFRRFSYDAVEGEWSTERPVSDANTDVNVRIMYVMNEDYLIFGGGVSTETMGQTGFWDGSDAVQAYGTQPTGLSTVRSIFALDENRIWMASGSDELFYFDGESWHEIAISFTGNASAIVGVDGEFWIVGTQRTLIHGVLIPEQGTSALIFGVAVVLLIFLRHRKRS